ncbi:MAG: hypothetical protein RIG63_08995 [Coleofasciculus chthonoplastes F3-SA18-01]
MYNKTLPIGRKPDELIPPYQEPFVPLSQCPGRRNQLNKQAFHSGSYPITRRLFIIVKQICHRRTKLEHLLLRW